MRPRTQPRRGSTASENRPRLGSPNKSRPSPRTGISDTEGRPEGGRGRRTGISDTGPAGRLSSIRSSRAGGATHRVTGISDTPHARPRAVPTTGISDTEGPAESGRSVPRMPLPDFGHGSAEATGISGTDGGGFRTRNRRGLGHGRTGNRDTEVPAVTVIPGTGTSATRRAAWGIPRVTPDQETDQTLQQCCCLLFPEGRP
jgi:hypothetical protein